MIHNVSSVEKLMDSAENIRTNVALNGYAIVRGFFDPNTIRLFIPKIYAYLDQTEILGTTKGTQATPRSNSCKWSVGAMTGSQPGVARLMVTIYNPINQENILDFRLNFEKLIEVRDIIRNDDNSTKDSDLKDGSFNACRFQIYPEGGGFMDEHTDYLAQQNSELPLLQLLLFITQKKLDFFEGGAYLVHNGKTIDIESLCQTGDILIYAGHSFHGVADIDPFKSLNTQAIRGRVVALVTIYK